MCDTEELVLHNFYDPVTKVAYPVLLAKSVLDAVLADKDFASEMFQAAKNSHNNYENGVEAISDTQQSTVVADFEINKDASISEDVALQNKGKYIWQYNDTKLLIESYSSHMEELEHSLKSKYFWENVSNDLISHNYNVSQDIWKKKWSSLNRSYKECVDKSGRGPCTFAFFDLIHDILGDKPSNLSPYTLSSLAKKSSTKIEAAEVNNKLGNKTNDTVSSSHNSEVVNKKKRTRNQSCSCNDDYKERKLELREKQIELQIKKEEQYEEKRDILMKYLQLKSNE